MEKSFLFFAEAHPEYDQIRIITVDGKERIRVNMDSKAPAGVAADQLQNKAHRYYFQETVQLEQGEIYVSPMDLNIERGEIEHPVKPMIRFGAGMFDAAGKRIGVIFINYKAKVLLDKLHYFSEDQAGQLMLLNRESYWLHGAKEEQNWGFMVTERSGQCLRTLEPELWNNHINADDSGQRITSAGMYTYTTVYPIGIGSDVSLSATAASGYYWKLISFVPHEIMAQALVGFRKWLLLCFTAAEIIFGFLSYLLVKAQLRRRQSDNALRKANEMLEQKVRLRTEALSDRNRRLTREMENRLAAESALADSELQYSTLLEAMLEGMIVIDTEVRITYCNKRFADMLGYVVDEIVGRNVVEFIDKKDVEHFGQQRDKREKGITEQYEIHWQCKDGSRLLTSVSPALLTDKNNDLSGSLGLVTDITTTKLIEEENRSLEHQLLQAQKMEALGALAGGVAHDFNNILSAIIGYADLTLAVAEKDTPLAKNINEIMVAGQRASKLVQQILAFSRQSQQNYQPSDIGPIIQEAVKLIRATTSTSIVIEAFNPDEIVQVMADSTQIHQIIMNLCTNACHAMQAKGGRLTIRVEKIHFNPEQAQKVNLTAGNYAKIALSDTGCGIAPDVQRMIFNPFFTTKETGKGTGLGLSVVHNIIKSMAGAIRVESEKNVGTTFTVFMPVCTETSREGGIVVPESILRGDQERILWVDDEVPLVKMGCQILESIGYQPKGFTCPEECLAEITNNPETYKLVISDYNMPKMNGLTLSSKIKAINAAIPVILCSGFCENITEEIAKAHGVAHYLMKPIAKLELARVIHENLEIMQN